MEDITATDYDPIYGPIREAISADAATRSQMVGATEKSDDQQTSEPSADEAESFSFESEADRARFEQQREFVIEHEGNAKEASNAEDASLPIAPIVIPNKGGARSIDLTYPPTVDGKRLTKIRMRMPLQEDLDAWSFGEIQTIREFISRLTGVHTEVLAKLSWPDSDALHSIFEGITPEYLLKARED